MVMSDVVRCIQLRRSILIVLTLCISLFTTQPANACSVVEPERRAEFDGVLLSIRRKDDDSQSPSPNSPGTEDPVVEEWIAVFDVRRWKAGTTLKTRPKRVTVSFPRYFDPTRQSQLDGGNCDDQAVKFTFVTRKKYRVSAFWYEGSEAELVTSTYFASRPFVLIR
jgi:hypothetical protein